jgi:hypothetical protein
MRGGPGSRRGRRGRGRSWRRGGPDDDAVAAGVPGDQTREGEPAGEGTREEDVCAEVSVALQLVTPFLFRLFSS